MHIVNYADGQVISVITLYDRSKILSLEYHAHWLSPEVDSRQSMNKCIWRRAFGSS